MAFSHRQPPGLASKVVQWNELTTEEQNELIRLGYKPPVGSILRNNIDVEILEKRS